MDCPRLSATQRTPGSVTSWRDSLATWKTGNSKLSISQLPFIMFTLAGKGQSVAGLALSGALKGRSIFQVTVTPSHTAPSQNRCFCTGMINMSTTKSPWTKGPRWPQVRWSRHARRRDWRQCALAPANVHTPMRQSVLSLLSQPMKNGIVPTCK